MKMGWLIWMRKYLNSVSFHNGLTWPTGNMYVQQLVSRLYIHKVYFFSSTCICRIKHNIGKLFSPPALVLECFAQPIQELLLNVNISTVDSAHYRNRLSSIIFTSGLAHIWISFFPLAKSLIILLHRFLFILEMPEWKCYSHLWLMLLINKQNKLPSMW